MEFDILTIAKNYIKAIKGGRELRLFFHPQVTLTELPNRLNPKGVTSYLEQILERAEKSRRLFKVQTYEIDSAITNHDTVVLQITWTGIMAVSVGTLGAGKTMRAHFAMFLQFENGQIIRQTNYNCFDDF